MEKLARDRREIREEASKVELADAKELIIQVGDHFQGSQYRTSCNAAAILSDLHHGHNSSNLSESSGAGA